MLERVMFWHDQSPGSGVPGPPLHPTRISRPSGGGAALIVATSNVGFASGPCAWPVAHARNIAIAIFRIAHILPRYPPLPLPTPVYTRFHEVHSGLPVHRHGPSLADPQTRHGTARHRRETA